MKITIWKIELLAKVDTTKIEEKKKFILKSTTKSRWNQQ